MGKFKTKKDRIYDIEGVGKFPSVTTILALKDKSAPLMGWAVKLTAAYFNQTVREMLAKGERVSYDNIDLLCEEAKKSYRKKQDTALDIGSKTHNAIEVFTKASCSSVGLKLVRALTEYPQIEKPFGAFLTWQKEHNFLLIEGEHTVYSRTFKFAGTLDAIATVDKRYTLVDYKASNAIRDEYLWQVAAYSKAYTEMTYLPIDAHGCLRVDKETGLPEWVEWTKAEINEGFEKFKCLLSLWWLENKKGGF